MLVIERLLAFAVSFLAASSFCSGEMSRGLDFDFLAPKMLKVRFGTEGISLVGATGATASLGGLSIWEWRRLLEAPLPHPARISSKEMRTALGATLSLLMMMRWRPVAGLHGADEGMAVPARVASCFWYW